MGIPYGDTHSSFFFLSSPWTLTKVGISKASYVDSDSPFPWSSADKDGVWGLHGSGFS